MKNAFYFTLQALFVLKILKFFGQVEKRLDQQYKTNFKMYDVKAWETNNFNTHIAHYLKKLKQTGNEV